MEGGKKREERRERRGRERERERGGGERVYTVTQFSFGTGIK